MILKLTIKNELNMALEAQNNNAPIVDNLPIVNKVIIQEGVQVTINFLEVIPVFQVCLLSGSTVTVNHPMQNQNVFSAVQITPNGVCVPSQSHHLEYHNNNDGSLSIVSAPNLAGNAYAPADYW